MQLADFEFLILCGGAGTRVDGLDKPLLLYKSAPMVQWIAKTVHPARKIWISANRHQAAYRRWGEVLSDTCADLPGAHGPLVGILCALEACQCPWLLVSPGDTPDLTSVWWEPLFRQKNQTGAVIFDGTQQQNLHVLLARDLAEDLRSYLTQGHHQVWQWLANVGVAVATTPTPGCFKNYNTFDDFTS